MSDKQIVRDFLIETLLFGEAEAMPEDSASLIDNGVIDSTAVLEIVSFVEERFGIHMADKEIVPANLDSVDAIARYISEKSDSVAA